MGMGFIEDCSKHGEADLGCFGYSSANYFSFFCFLFLKFYLFIFREVKGGEHQCVVASRMPPIGDLARNPDWESNQ